MFLHKFPSGPLETNAILFGCPETLKAAVIDPASGSSVHLQAKAKELNLQIEKILITHSHWDHIADAKALKMAIAAPIYVHPLDAKNLEFPGSDGIPLFFPVQGVQPDHLIQDGEQISVGKLLIDVMHCPGHSPGSVCYYLRDQNVLFSGDLLFEGSIGNLHLPTAQPDRMWESLRRIAQLPPETRVVPGHGRDTELSRETWLTNPLCK